MITETKYGEITKGPFPPSTLADSPPSLGLLFPGHKDEKMVNYYCKLTSKDYKASEHLKRNNPDKVLRFIEDYARNETMPQPASKPLDLGKEIEIGRNIYVWIHRSDRLSKKTEMYARFYEFKGVDEEQGEYQLLRFIKDDCR